MDPLPGSRRKSRNIGVGFNGSSLTFPFTQQGEKRGVARDEFASLS
jgi:hypothetical protein